MPHDKNGRVVSVGDRVMILATIKEIHLTEEFCNLTLVTLEPMFPTNQPSTMVLNAKQVIVP